MSAGPLVQPFSRAKASECALLIGQDEKTQSSKIEKKKIKKIPSFLKT